MQIVALDESRDLAVGIADELGLALSELEQRTFEDGEGKIRPLAPVQGHDLCIVQSLHSGPRLSAHDKLCRLLFLIATLRDHGAAWITVVVPYLCYARKDRRTKPQDPITTRYVAQLLETAGCDHIITFEVHNLAAFQNAFRCQTTHLEVGAAFQDAVAWRADGAPLVVLSPDPGGVKRAQLFRETLEERLGQAIGFGFMEKRRSGGVMSVGALAGDFAGRSVVIVDDIIASGSTMLGAAQACRDAGAAKVFALAAHGLFTGQPQRLFAGDLIDRVLVTDSIAPFRLPDGRATDRLEIIGTAALFADTIRDSMS
ncbi:ribose-phosphate diphosphokinase [Yoonia sp.]|uniref:ribose-phosphate diphosphokinase n=1 Tax=Yoonia sp. TaxID=2212373 RepID=UPI0025FA21A9|nr:ribose-phosphate diphosphokinase [Yoonia sp.]